MDDEPDVAKQSVCILLVEDNPQHRELIIESIKEANVLNEIYWVDNGPDAVSYLTREGEYADEVKYPVPNLILLDMKLPGMDGKEVLRLIKSDERSRSIPVIMLTSSDQERDIQECYALGVNSYITKPISFGDFMEKVKAIPFYWVMVNSLA